jgi:hypothetical protein
MGGVHVGEVNANDPDEVAMNENMLRWDSHRPTLRELVPVSRVVIQALQPLYNAIIE